MQDRTTRIEILTTISHELHEFSSRPSPLTPEHLFLFQDLDLARAFLLGAEELHWLSKQKVSTPARSASHQRSPELHPPTTICFPLRKSAPPPRREQEKASVIPIHTRFFFVKVLLYVYVELGSRFTSAPFTLDLTAKVRQTGVGHWADLGRSSLL